MKTFAEFNQTMSDLAKSIRSGFGSPHEYAVMFTGNNRACWKLVEMIRFEDPDFYAGVEKSQPSLLELKEWGQGDDSMDKLMEHLAYGIIETALNYHPTLKG